MSGWESIAGCEVCAGNEWPAPPVYVSSTLKRREDGSLGFCADGKDVPHPAVSACGRVWVWPMHYGFSERANKDASAKWYEKDFWLKDGGRARMHVRSALGGTLKAWGPIRVEVSTEGGEQAGWVIETPRAGKAGGGGIGLRTTPRMPQAAVGGLLYSLGSGRCAFMANGCLQSNPAHDIELDCLTNAPGRYGFALVSEGSTWATWARRFELQDGGEAQMLCTVVWNETDGTWSSTRIAVKAVNGSWMSWNIDRDEQGHCSVAAALLENQRGKRHALS